MKTGNKVKMINSFTAVINNFSWNKDFSFIRDIFLSYPLVILKNSSPVCLDNLKILAELFGKLFTHSDNCSQKQIEKMRKFHRDKDLSVIRVSNTVDKNGTANGTLGNGLIDWHADFAHLENNFHGSILYNQKNGGKAITSFCHTPDLGSIISKYDRQKLKISFGYHSLHDRVFRMRASVYKELVKFTEKKSGGKQNIVRKPIIITTIRNKKGFYLSPATLVYMDNNLKASKYLKYIEKIKHYHHNWEPYDILIYDNLSLLHKRSAFSGKRVLNRLNFNFDKIG